MLRFFFFVAPRCLCGPSFSNLGHTNKSDRQKKCMKNLLLKLNNFAVSTYTDKCCQDRLLRGFALLYLRTVL